MIPISENKIIEIDITNVCWLRCGNCTRLVGHHKKPFFMSLAEVDNAIQSLNGYTGVIGIIGGEPTMHPEFASICRLLQARLPRLRCVLFTSGYKWDHYKELIWGTFGHGVFYNDHSDSAQCHQPVLVAIDEVIQDKALMWRLIDDCWVQKTWSASIRPKGAFFCEVAGALDALFEMGGGYPVEEGWWRKTPSEFQDQVKQYCVRCSAALPMKRPAVKPGIDLVSRLNYERLKAAGSPKVDRGLVQIIKGPVDLQVQSDSKKWHPGRYLSSILRRKKNLRLNEIWLIGPFMRLRRWCIYLRGIMGLERTPTNETIDWTKPSPTLSRSK